MIKNSNQNEYLEFPSKHYLTSAQKLLSDNVVKRTSGLSIYRSVDTITAPGRPSAARPVSIAITVKVGHRLNKLTHMPYSHIYKTSNCPIHISQQLTNNSVQITLKRLYQTYENHKYQNRAHSLPPPRHFSL